MLFTICSFRVSFAGCIFKNFKELTTDFQIETADLSLELLSPIREDSLNKLKRGEEDKIENGDVAFTYSHIAHILTGFPIDVVKLLDFDISDDDFEVVGRNKKTLKLAKALDVIISKDCDSIDLRKDIRKADELGCRGLNFVLHNKNISTHPIIGLVSVLFYDLPNSDQKLANLSIFIDSDFQGKGLGTQALTAVIEKVLELDEVFNICYFGFVENEAARKLSDKVFANIVAKNENLCREDRRIFKTKEKELFEDMIYKKDKKPICH